MRVALLLLMLMVAGCSAPGAPAPTPAPGHPADGQADVHVLNPGKTPIDALIAWKRADSPDVLDQGRVKLLPGADAHRPFSPPGLGTYQLEVSFVDPSAGTTSASTSETWDTAACLHWNPEYTYDESVSPVAARSSSHCTA